MESNNSQESQESLQSSEKDHISRFQEDYLDGKKVIVVEDDGEYE